MKQEQKARTTTPVNEANPPQTNTDPTPAAAPTPPTTTIVQPVGGKAGWAVAVVLLILLLFVGLWWWMMYGPGAKNSVTTPTTQESSGSGSSGSGSGGTGGSGGSGGGTTTQPSSGTTIDNLANVKVGDTKATVDDMGAGMAPNCVTVQATAVNPQQEVCTYVDGTKTVKITYQNEKVVDVNKVGF